MHLIQSAAFRLTLWYLGIIMVLSLVFSTALFRVSDGQMTDNYNHERSAIERFPVPLGLESQRYDYIQALSDELNGARRSLLLRLSALNLATLLLGGGAAFWLARRTLTPIQDAMEAQGRFTADASHELRTPLTAMRSEIEVALREKQLSAADARKLLHSNLEELAKLEALSAGLLRLARSDKLDPTAVSPVPVRQLIEAAIDRFQTQLAARHINLEVDADDSSVEGDATSLTELLAILLDNAIKYSPEKSTVTISGHANGPSVNLAVADQGTGINASDIPHIFERFYRADRSRSKEQVSGYGLGLSIAKRITDLHHGAITVESTPGHGSVFNIKLPVTQAPAQHPVFRF
ncbi:MAG TPA: HAMP domain-containing sensor histidine kinase [Candidatus Saccharimonadia bacterium]|jgi:signal transduction histidine kinase